jgi:predicted Rdx family selenoprotein
VATELSDGHIRETDITLTPVHEGRFEVYVNGTKIYDRKEAGDKDFLGSLREIRKAKQVLTDAISGTAAPATAH